MNQDHLQVLPGTTVRYVDARRVANALRPGAWEGLPYTARVHAENIVRRAEPARIDEYLQQLIERRRDIDFPWFPARVVCHDILGQTALVDLAGLRDAIASQGGDPAAAVVDGAARGLGDDRDVVAVGGLDPRGVDDPVPFVRGRHPCLLNPPAPSW